MRIKTKQDNIQGCSKRQGSCMAGNDEMLKKGSKKSRRKEFHYPGKESFISRVMDTLSA